MDRPESATPMPAVLIPTGIIHRRGRRSVHQPNAGCATEDSTVAASVSPETAA